MAEQKRKPFLKWAGGKVWLAPLAELLQPGRYGRYFEPFLGGGSLFFAIHPRHARLSDNNSELIEAYLAVASDPHAVIRHLRRMRYSRASFARIRASRPRSTFTRAARFVYLNRTAWNGLYRVNRRGEFNVPFGSYSRPLDGMPDRLRDASKALQGVSLTACDFEVALRSAKRGDYVYLDPPYVSAHRNNGFLRYNARVFAWTDQLRLAATVGKLDRSGVRILMSNADHPSISHLYASLSIRRVARRSLVAADIDRRRDTTELLISNFELPRFEDA